MNKQPFYHRCTLLFTTTTGCSESEFVDALKAYARTQEARRSLGLVWNSIEVEPTTWEEPEPGDPADLL